MTNGNVYLAQLEVTPVGVHVKILYADSNGITDMHTQDFEGADGDENVKALRALLQQHCAPVKYDNDYDAFEYENTLLVLTSKIDDFKKALTEFSPY